IGKLHIIFSALAAIFLLMSLFKNKTIQLKKSKYVYSSLFAFFGLLISVFFTLEISKPVWELTSVMAFFQYPWRFLILIVFFSSFLAGFIVWFLKEITFKYNLFKFINYIILSLATVLLLLFNVKLFTPQSIVSRTAEYYTNEYALKMETSKISDEYMPRGFEKPKKENEIVNQRLIANGGVSGITEASSKTQNYKFDINVIRKSSFLLKIAPFPAWKAELNNKPLILTVTDKGYAFSLEPGKYKLNVSFEQTTAQVIGNILSLSGLAVLVIGIIYFRKFRVD
ncbi:MAG: hypothetical protein M1365_11830, partial [Actinobacteria bacterium]|nr:hypothetical protein [Actinomycetota bacterium]